MGIVQKCKGLYIVFQSSLLNYPLHLTQKDQNYLSSLYFLLSLELRTRPGVVQGLYTTGRGLGFASLPSVFPGFEFGGFARVAPPREANAFYLFNNTEGRQ